MNAYAQIASAVSTGDPEIRLKYLTRTVRQGFSPQCDSTPGDGVTQWAVLKVGCVNNGAFHPAENKRLPEDTEPRPDLVVHDGELVISRANTRELVGSAAVVHGNYPRLMLCDKTYALSLDATRLEPDFAAMVLGTPKLRSLIEAEATGASHSMQNISLKDILNLPIPAPSRDEQRAILTQLAANLGELDVLINRAEDLIAAFHRRRTALIHAAVTGGIDASSVNGEE